MLNFARTPGHAETDFWTAGFFNERFPAPVSPLGWSLVGPLVEQIALRDPLHFVGCRRFDGEPIVKTRLGHPYAAVGVFQTLYKPFPGTFLPDDAARFFPGGDTSLRRRAPYPCCTLDLRMLLGLLRSLLAGPADWWPWGNYRRWAAFKQRHAHEMSVLEAETDRLEATGKDRAGAPALSALSKIRPLLDRCRHADEELLRIHRWSLTHADLWYSLLRRMLASWAPPGGRDAAAALVTGLPNKSLQVDRALRELAARAAGHPDVARAVAAGELPSGTDGQAFRAALDAFMAEHGHRSFSLDVMQPSFRDEPRQVLGLLAGLIGSPALVPSAAGPAVLAEVGLSPWQRWLAGPVLALARRYLPLREDQRYAWQRSLALQRRLCLLAGRGLAAQGRLARAADVFYLRVQEIWTDGDHSAAAQERKSEHDAWFAAWQQDPAGHYPPFLRGDEPFPPAPAGAARPAESAARPVLKGLPVSPGTGEGPVRLLTGPGELGQVRRGDVLVVTSTDPAWTPVFGLLAALVMERGGQLSHGAVVAREYGLPAVAGLPGATALLRDGETVRVDGAAGTVTRK